MSDLKMKINIILTDTTQINEIQTGTNKREDTDKHTNTRSVTE